MVAPLSNGASSTALSYYISIISTLTISLVILCRPQVLICLFLMFNLFVHSLSNRMTYSTPAEPSLAILGLVCPYWVSPRIRDASPISVFAPHSGSSIHIAQRPTGLILNSWHELIKKSAEGRAKIFTSSREWWIICVLPLWNLFFGFDADKQLSKSVPNLILQLGKVFI